jgi:thioredoxin-like negative regulator of GroEL
MKRTFQKLLVISALTLAVLSAPKKRSSDFFPRGSGVVLNMNSDDFEDTVQTTDNLIFLYVFDSEQDKSQQVNKQILSPILDEMKGYFKLVAFDCQEDHVK